MLYYVVYGLKTINAIKDESEDSVYNTYDSMNTLMTIYMNDDDAYCDEMDDTTIPSVSINEDKSGYD